MKILILGGYGRFGGQLAMLLADQPQLTLMIAGRSLAKATAFCNTFKGAAQKQAVMVDRSSGVDQQLQQLMPDVVVDASGPFQEYGDNPYIVIKACIALGIHYFDLADDSGFVAAVDQFDAAAKAKGVVVLSGVSTFPVLSAAVVQRLAVAIPDVKEITIGLAPSPFAAVGLNVVRAITSYAGKPVTLLRNGVNITAYALTETWRYTIAPPGKLPLHSRVFSLIDVPDLRVLPQLWPGVDSIKVGAAPVPVVFHYMLMGFAWLVRLKLLRSLEPLAHLFHKSINELAWGEHRGGLYVLVEGRKADGTYSSQSWHMLAEGDDGPFIPSMAVAALVQRMLNGQLLAPGARAAAGELELGDYENQFARRRIVTGTRDDPWSLTNAPLFQRLLGNMWDILPERIREMHTLHDFKDLGGFADIERGSNIPARLIGHLLGFPAAGKTVPLLVNLNARRGKEHWLRTFGRKKIKSVLSEGTGTSSALLDERLGLVTFGMALVLERGKLNYVVRRWCVLGVPLPLMFAPRTKAFEYEANERFNFSVEISYPLVGLIVKYEGHLQSL
jgi:hypothetical protein